MKSPAAESELWPSLPLKSWNWLNKKCNSQFSCHLFLSPPPPFSFVCMKKYNKIKTLLNMLDNEPIIVNVSSASRHNPVPPVALQQPRNGWNSLLCEGQQSLWHTLQLVVEKVQSGHTPTHTQSHVYIHTQTRTHVCVCLNSNAEVDTEEEHILQWILST